MSKDASTTSPNFVASNHELLMVLAEGQSLRWMSRTCGWPTRQIHIFASRNGYLFTSYGTPYRPPAHGEQRRIPGQNSGDHSRDQNSADRSC
jgi:hypothetical protein